MNKCDPFSLNQSEVTMKVYERPHFGAVHKVCHAIFDQF